jgi:ABC-type nickel/cobalt efflux system permease component RcnA
MRRSSPGRAGVVGIVLAVGLVLLILKWALLTAAILVVPFGTWWIYDRVSTSRREQAAHQRATDAAARRAEVESRAVVDIGGGCGWCGSRLAHVDGGGRPVLPLDEHRDEIEDLLRDDEAARARR